MDIKQIITENNRLLAHNQILLLIILKKLGMNSKEIEELNIFLNKSTKNKNY